MIITNSRCSIQRLSSWANKRGGATKSMTIMMILMKITIITMKTNIITMVIEKKTGHSQLHKGLFGQNVWAFSTGKYNRDTHTLYIKNMINIL